MASRASRFSILAAIYTALANSSLLFSVFPINAWTIGYFCFAGLVLLLSLVVPPLPVVLKLEAAKEAALEGIDRQVHLSFYRNTADSTQRREDIDYEKVKTLIELRERIEAISTWPFRLRTVSAGLSVILFSSVPVVIQILLEWPP